MKSSVMWSTLSFLTIGTLGAGAFAFGGCTVTSGTVNDTEGGTTNPQTDAGRDSATAADGSTSAACPGNPQKNKFEPAECQSCSEQNCCSQLKTCYSIAVVPNSGEAGVTPLDCDNYALCYADCLQNDNTDACYQDCRDASLPQIVAAYEGTDGVGGILGCQETTAACKTPCGF